MNIGPIALQEPKKFEPIQLEVGKKYETATSVVVKIVSDLGDKSEYRYLAECEDNPGIVIALNKRGHPNQHSYYKDFFIVRPVELKHFETVFETDDKVNNAAQVLARMAVCDEEVRMRVENGGHSFKKAERGRHKFKITITEVLD